MLDKKRILEVLGFEWKSTNAITKKVGSNWYVVFLGLHQLEQENEVEKLRLDERTYWRLIKKVTEE